MSYGDETGLTDYATARGVTLTQSAAVLLTLAHDYIESLSYKGAKTDYNQANQWPRVGVYVDGRTLASDTVPSGIVNAEYAQAIAIDQGNGAQNAIAPAVKREKLAVMEVEYQDGASSSTIDVKTMALLRKYLASDSGGLNQVSVRKA